MLWTRLGRLFNRTSTVAAIQNKRRAGDRAIHRATAPIGRWGSQTPGIESLEGRVLLSSVTLLSEGFEGNFPADNGWSVGDSNTSGTPAYWGSVDSAFGGEGTLGGVRKGYCAAVGNAGASSSPIYQNDMAAYMSRSIDLSGLSSATLNFWYKIPTMESYWEHLRAYVGSTPLFDVSVSSFATWTQASINLNSYLGSTQTLKFEFYSDSSVTYEGAYLDDILVAGTTGAVNDDFVSATAITGSIVTVTAANVEATKEVGEPDHAGNSGGTSVWWNWTAPSSGEVTIDTTGSNFNTLLGVYTGSGVSALTPVASNDDSAAGTTSSVTFTALSGTTYRIAVDGYDGASGNITLNLAAPPANNDFASAAVLTGSAATVTGTNVNATKESGEPNHAGNSGGKSVWWKWTAPSGGDVTIHTTGSNFNTLLGVYTGGSVSALTTIASNDDSGAGTTSSVTFTAVSGTTYRIAVDGYGGASGNVTLYLNFVAAPANNDFASATAITGSIATVTGTNVAATKETGEPDHAGNSGGKSVWRNWTAPSGGNVTIDTSGSNFNTLLGVYTGSSVSALTTIASSDNSVADTTSSVTFSAVSGTTYRIAVDGYGGDFGFIRLNLALRPPNNNFAGATPITGSMATVTATNVNANKESSEPYHAGNSGGKSVWWNWTAPAGGNVSIDTIGSNFNTLLGVYAGLSVSALTNIAGNDDSVAGTTSRVTFTAVSGTTYRIAVDGYNGASGNITLHLNLNLFGLTGTDIGPALGTNPLPGSDWVDGDQWVIRGGGNDIWGNDDAFRFEYQAWTGDFDVRVRVVSMTATTNWAKVAIMARADLTPGSVNAFTLATPGNGSGSMQGRAIPRNASFMNSRNGPNTTQDGSSPLWLRLMRQGNTFFSSWAIDNAGTPGEWWYPQRQTLENMPAAVHLGLAVTSNNASLLTEARVDHYSVASFTTLPQGWPAIYVPGPEGGAGYFGVREVINNGQIWNETQAVDSLLSGAGTIVDYEAPTINVFDAGGGNHFTGLPFGVVAANAATYGAVTHIALVAKSTIAVLNEGDYTFSVNSDDGFRLAIDGRYVNRFEGARGQIDSFVTVHLSPGKHTIQLTYHQGSGPSGVEFLVAPGEKHAFDAAFRLVGDPSSTTIPASETAGEIVGGWNVSEAAYKNYQNLGSIANVDQMFLSAPSGLVTVTGTSPTVNFRDPDNPGWDGAFGTSSRSPFFIDDKTPYQLSYRNRDDQHFGLVARGTLRIAQEGDYTFGVRSDDGFSFQILGATFTGVRGNGFITASGDTITFPDPHIDSNTLGQVHLRAGDYPVTLKYFERDGGAFVELSGTKGLKETWDNSFTLLGGTPRPSCVATGFALVEPRFFINEITPTGYFNPLDSTLVVTFNHPVNPATFLADDVVLRGPAGVVAVTVQQLTATDFRLAPATPLRDGDYSLAIGPHIATLAGLEMDQDGNWTPGESTDVFQGNWAWVAPNIRPMQINTQVNGHLNSQASEDRWTFSAAANTQVRLDLVNTSAAGAGFTLTGPNGWTGFAGVSDDSNLVTLPYAGAYVLKAKSLVPTNGISYACILQQTAVQTLELGATYNGSFAGSDQAQTFRVQTPGGSSLLVALNDSGVTNRNELYVRFGSPPSRSEYDYRFENSGLANQTIVVPSAQQGSWYAMIYSQHVDVSSAFVLSASTSSLYASRISPLSHGNAVPAVISLYGSGFDASTTIELVGADGESYLAEVTQVSGTSLTADLELRGCPAGVYDVRVTRGAFVHQLSVPFTVIDGGEAHFDSSITAPAGIWMRFVNGVWVLGQRVTLWIEYRNTGSLAMAAPVLRVTGTRNAALSTNEVRAWGSGTNPAILQPGEGGRVAVYLVGLTGDLIHPQVTFALRAFDPPDSDMSGASSMAPVTLAASDDYRDASSTMQLLADGTSELGDPAPAETTDASPLYEPAIIETSSSPLNEITNIRNFRSPYGWRFYGPEYHEGIDIYYPLYSALGAVGSGSGWYALYKGMDQHGGGYYVELRNVETAVWFRYLHLDQQRTEALFYDEWGSTVIPVSTPNQVIAYSGNSGALPGKKPYGPHLHLKWSGGNPLEAFAYNAQAPDKPERFDASNASLANKATSRSSVVMNLSVMAPKFDLKEVKIELLDSVSGDIVYQKWEKTLSVEEEGGPSYVWHSGTGELGHALGDGVWEIRAYLTGLPAVSPRTPGGPPTHGTWTFRVTATCYSPLGQDPMSSYEDFTYEYTDDGSDSDSALMMSMDPNDKIGPAGAGPQGYLAAGRLLSYRVNFENDAKATAPAQRVSIIDQLDTDVDEATFEVTEVGFGDTLLSVPAGLQYFQATVPMTYNGKTFDVWIETGLRYDSRQVFANFVSLDPNTLLPPDFLTGFLPPEDGTGRGMGYMSYVIHSKAGLVSGAQIRNVAFIQFDDNDVITTNQIDVHDASKGTDPAKECLNTIDAAGPSSSVSILPAAISTNDFVVAWSGMDDLGGSGIAGYDIYVSEDGGPFSLWLNRTTEISATFMAEGGHRYAFYSTATDYVGHGEAPPAVPDAETAVEIAGNTPPTVIAGGNDTINEGQTFTRTGSFTDPDAGDSWTGTVDYGDGSGVQTLLLNPDNTFVLSHRYGQEGAFNVRVFIADSQNATGLDTAAITVFDVAPQVNAGTPGSVALGETFSTAGSFIDPGDDTWTATVDYGDGSGALPLNLLPDKTFQLSRLYSQPGTYTVAVTVTDDQQVSGTDSFQVVVMPPRASVQTMQINDGSAQRSMVNSLTLNFTQDLAGLAASALSLTTKAGVLVPCTLNVTRLNARTYLITFSGTGITGGSLADGRYRLTVHANLVQDPFGRPLTADFTGEFWRVYGDCDGRGFVTATNYTTIRQAMLQPASYRWYYDNDNNGLISVTELLLVRANIGKVF